ncbi:hypothetical protein VIGAN_09132300 [Vigna angularis var. angularis]|uniref:Uncharacterized protein n=1 Tax=Vigna angularis var. angularis TaxID=157739 RepID=A0A0S3SY86_PHAAN|nr:hypothetical protein VIGAN_09132300 [Vigna angularis var. angularis]
MMGSSTWSPECLPFLKQTKTLGTFSALQVQHLPRPKRQKVARLLPLWFGNFLKRKRIIFEREVENKRRWMTREILQQQLWVSSFFQERKKSREGNSQWHTLPGRTL